MDVMSSKFAGAQGSSADAAFFAYACNDLNATVAPSQSNFAKAFDSAPTAASREAVIKNAAKNGFAVGVSAPAQTTGMKAGM